MSPTKTLVVFWQQGLQPVNSTVRERESKSVFRRFAYYAVLAALIFLSSTAAMAERCVQISNHPHFIAFPSSNFSKGSNALHFDPACQDNPSVNLGYSGPGMAYASSFGRAMSICQANISQPVTAVNNPYPDRNLWACQSFTLPDRLGPDDRFLGAVNAPDAATALSLCNRGFRQHPTNYVRKRSDGSWRCYYLKGRSGSGSGRGGFPFCTADINLPLADLRLHAVDGMNSGIQFKRQSEHSHGSISHTKKPRAGQQPGSLASTRPATHHRIPLTARGISFSSRRTALLFR